MAGSVPNPGDDARPRLVITIPDPSLVVLVGAAGAGKSTFAMRWFQPAEILSSDALRALIAGDAADQSVSRAAFALLHRQLGRRLRAGRLTVVDATNVGRAARRSLLVRAAASSRPAVAIVLDLPAATVHERNLSRAERVVEPVVIDRQLATLRRTIARGLLRDEGFSAIHRLASTADVEATRVVRVQVPGPG